MAASVLNGRSRNSNNTAPPGFEVQERTIGDLDLSKLVRDAVHLEMRHSVKVELEEKQDRRDGALLVMSLATLAAILGLALALSLALAS